MICFLTKRVTGLNARRVMNGKFENGRRSIGSYIKLVGEADELSFHFRHDVTSGR